MTQPDTRMQQRPHGAPVWAMVLLLSLGAQPLLAQGVYRSVGADGRVTFTDQPPDGPPTQTVAPAPTPVPSVELPFALRNVVSRYPVVLYTANDCAPCNSGRQLLEARGIPFAEKTVNTAQDAETFKRLSNGDSLPWLTLGQVSVKGFSAGEWNRSLEAAGYPAQSALPARYRRPPPVPVSVVETVSADSADRASAHGSSGKANVNATASNAASARAPGGSATSTVPVAPPAARAAFASEAVKA